MTYPDIEAALVVAAEALFTDARVCTELPSDLADVLPVIQVGCIGGQDMQIAVNRSNVDIDCYADGRIAARTLAYQAWEWLRFTIPGTTAGDAFISKVKTINSPNWAPYDNTTLRRFTFTVQVFSRAVAA